MNEPFEHVVIVGCGLLGASLGLAMRAKGLARKITGVGREGSRSAEIARSRGAIDESSFNPAAAVRTADLVVFCTPVRQFEEGFRAVAGSLQKGAIVTDVGSTKSQVLEWAEKILPPTVHFVGSHPMAGSEKSGPEAARADLYTGAVCLVCPPAASAKGDNSNVKAFERVRGLWKTLDMRVIELEPAAHDRWVAAISHLPHAVAFSLVNAAAREPAMLEAVAGGFLDTTRVASSDVAMWTDIFLTNREAILEAMDNYDRDWAALKAAIKSGDPAALRILLTKARETRDELITRRKAAGLKTRSE